LKMILSNRVNAAGVRGGMPPWLETTENGRNGEGEKTKICSLLSVIGHLSSAICFSVDFYPNFVRITR